MIQDPSQWEDLPELPPLPEPDQPPQKPKKSQPAKSAKKGSTSSASSSASAKRSGFNPVSNLSPAWEKELRAGLGEVLISTGAIAGLAMPVTGAVMVSRAPQTVEALIRIARRDERVRSVLLAMLRYSAYAELAMVVGAIGIAVSVDMGRIPQIIPLWVSSSGRR